MASWQDQTRAGLAVAASLLFAAPAHGFTFMLGDDTRVDGRLTLTYSAAVRGESQSEALLGELNADDGNRNYHRGSFINNRASSLGELDIRRGRFGAFLSGSAFYDRAVAQGSNDNDAPERVNKSGPHNEFSDAAISRLGRRARLLDAYVYGGFELGATDLNIRVGNQLVNWGESVFAPNLTGAQNPADAARSNVPGTEVRDVLLPAGQALVQWGITDWFGIDAYYQWEWRETELEPVGGYFSTSDLVGPGAEFLIVDLGIIPDLSLLDPILDLLPGDFDPGQLDRIEVQREDDIRPRNSGQWGIATRFNLGMNWEVQAYYVRYHDKNPTGAVFNNPGFVDLLLGNSTYQIRYFDDIDMGAVSFSTLLFGSTALTGELSYRSGAGVNVDAPGLAGELVPTPTRADVWQANLGFLDILLPTRFWDGVVLVGELSGLRVQSVDPVEDDGERFDSLSNTRNALVANFLGILQYRSVLPGIDVEFAVSHANSLSGESAVAGALGALRAAGDRRYGIEVGARYLENLEVRIGYNFFTGTPDPGKRPLADRSFGTFAVSYSF